MRIIVLIITLSALATGTAWAQTEKEKPQPPVSTDERLKELEQDVDQLSKELKAVRSETDASRPGKTNFLLTGYGTAGFVNAKGKNSTFSSQFNPIFLWRLDDRLFFEGEIELKLSQDQTETGLEYAQLSYVLNDYATIGAGKFLNPANFFIERLHPSWINKLPDKPVALGDQGLMPEGEIGVHVHGAIPLPSSSLQYALFVSNGPQLVTDTPDGAGLVSQDAFLDNNNGKALGGRIGYRPLDGMEFGYALEWGTVGASGDPEFNDVNALFQSVDFSYAHEVTSIGGQIEMRGQWIWSHIDRAIYDASGALGFGPLSFDNRSNGGYVQVAYRPSDAESSVLKNLEGVVRFDELNAPAGDPYRVDESRWTLGVDYWCGPSSVFKLAYQFDDTANPGKNSNAVLAQFAIGF